MYDVHGNIDALEAVLSDPRAQRPDAVVIGGDAVPGPFANATLERIAAIEAPVHWVRGNGEREVASGDGIHDRDAAGTRYVNAGSVGLPYEGDAAARWIWIEDGEPDLRATPYDAAAAGGRMLDHGWPDEDSINAALTHPIDPMEVTRLFEGMRA